MEKIIFVCDGQNQNQIRIHSYNIAYQTLIFYSLKITWLKIDPFWNNLALTQHWINFIEYQWVVLTLSVLDTTYPSFTLKCIVSCSKQCAYLKHSKLQIINIINIQKQIVTYSIS